MQKSLLARRNYHRPRRLIKLVVQTMTNQIQVCTTKVRGAEHEENELDKSNASTQINRTGKQSTAKSPVFLPTQHGNLRDNITLQHWYGLK